MPVTIKVSQIKYKDNNGNYVGINGVAEQSTQEEIAAIEAAGETAETAIETKGAQTIASIPSDYTTLSNEVSALDKELRFLPRQFIDRDAAIAGKYWNGAGTMGNSGSYSAIPAFHVEAGDYWIHGMSLNFSWFKSDANVSTKLSEYAKTGDHFALPSGTLYISGSPSAKAIANWVCANYKVPEYILPDIPYGFIEDINSSRIDGFNSEIVPTQFIGDTYDENKYWSSASTKNASNGWYAFERFHVEAGMYFSNGPALNFSWFAPDDGTTPYKLVNDHLGSGVIKLKKSGIISISSTNLGSTFSNFRYFEEYAKKKGFYQGYVAQYRNISDLITEKYLSDNEYDVSTSSKVSRDGNTFTVIVDDAGANSNTFESNEGIVVVKYNIDFTNSGSNNLRIYLKIFKSDSTVSYEKFDEISATGTMSGQYTFDAASLIVYQNAVQFQILVWGNAGTVFTINNLAVYEENELQETEYYDVRLDKMLLNLANGIDKVEAEAKTKTGLVLRGPDGQKYGVVVGSTGQFLSYPYVPNKYLVFGNSITWGYSDPLLGNFGMASTQFSKDWVYKVDSAIKEKNPSVTYTRVYSSPFEHSETLADARSWMSEITSNLTQDTDLVLIEMGDNVNTDAKLAVFETSFPEFLSLIRTNCVKARVIVLGIWFNKAAVKAIMLDGCEKYGCEFVDISGLRNSSTEATAGDTIYYSDGTTGTISANAATHPGDAGMLAIGNAVVEAMAMD